MSWKKWVGLLVIIALAVGGYRVASIVSGVLLPSGEDAIEAVRVLAAAQNEDGFYRPERRPLVLQAANPLNNVYFGDLHIHTSVSSDAYLFGNRFDMDAAYRIAKGGHEVLRTGERIELARPLDFAALTDHAEGFGRRMACAQADISASGREECLGRDEASLFTFLAMRERAQQRPMIRSLTLFNDDPKRERDFAAATWQQVQDAAARHYEPGVFTTFAAYEYSPPLPDRGKHHRNVVFRSLQVPKYAVSAFDAISELDLWKDLEANCQADCQFLTIPHNLNKTWGLAFSGETIDGVAYTEDDWLLRNRSEPIVEMIQIKGNSECSTAYGAGDEECGFEQFFPPCADGEETSCIHPTAMARDGLQIGLALEDKMGVNPLEIGFIGSTDTHNSNPGDVEEWDYRGATTFTGSPAKRRMDPDNMTGIRITNPGGLAAVWAPENTRDALFDAMMRKEVYATSGTRIKLRVFAGFELPEDIATTGDLAAAYALGVPMGGRLAARAGNLGLFVWALQDPDNAPLAKLQVVKGWIENGQRQERVYDIACGRSLIDPATGRCQDNGATVNLDDCSWDSAAGSPELKARWTDPDYAPDEDAFYYVRVVQNPTCRWTTYDSLRLGREPPSDSPATVTEMAWGSPIWIKTEVAQ